MAGAAIAVLVAAAVVVISVVVIVLLVYIIKDVKSENRALKRRGFFKPISDPENGDGMALTIDRRNWFGFRPGADGSVTSILPMGQVFSHQVLAQAFGIEGAVLDKSYSPINAAEVVRELPAELMADGTQSL